jgi:hypothetical protein
LFVFIDELIMIFSSSGRAAQSTKWDGTSGHRIHVSDLAAGISRREVERAFGKFGPVNEVSCFY